SRENGVSRDRFAWAHRAMQTRRVDLTITRSHCLFRTAAVCVPMSMRRALVVLERPTDLALAGRQPRQNPLAERTRGAPQSRTSMLSADVADSDDRSSLPCADETKSC